jgi:PAS domain S-box-containing protein
MNTIINKQEDKSKLLNGIISNVPSIILVISPDYKILEFNPAAERLFGVESGEGSGKDQLELVIPDEVRLAIKKEGKKVLDGIPTREFETQVMAPDRNVRTFRWKIDRLVDTPGRGGNIICIGTDITERKQAEDSLRESEARFRLLVEQTGDSFFIVDYAGKIFDVNHQACQSLGYTREELLSMTILEVDTEVEKMKHKTRFWDSLEPGQHITIEGVHRRKNGSTFPVEARVGRLDLGEKRFLLALSRDITERKQREEELGRAFVQINELKDKLEEENIYLRKEIELRYRHEKIVGESDAIKRVLSQAEKVATTGTCVLILGETGTGKELLAYAIHNMSNRKGHAMITVNCAALPATLIESELFGREKGAFTGALKRQIGRFESAHGSTIFLDEIGDLPIELQAKLLRALQEGQFERLGSSKTLSIDVRVIAATNRNLAEMVREQKFRNDLYYRLNVFPITLPPLRERQEDIPMLVWSIVNEFAKSMGKPITKIQKKTMQSLTQYAWPGNIRELKNIIERAMIMSSGSILEIEHIVDKDAPTDISMSLEEIEKTHILKVLQNTNWRIRGEKGAAKILEIKATTLEARMKKIGIQRQT